MKIVFLDMDGVANSHAFMTERAKKKEWEHDGPLPDDFDPKAPAHWVRMIDPKAIARLNTLIEATGALVVISSSWRHAHSTHRMRQILRLAGFKGEVLDSTPAMTGPRSHEISSWLAAHPQAKRFVILDDNSDAGLGIEKWFVKTDLAVGLTDADVKKAINILGRK